MNAAAADTRPKGPVIRLLAWFATLFWWLLLSVLVAAALYAGLGRQLTQSIDNYRPQIEQLLSDRLGHEIHIGSMSSQWSWLNPTIIARDLVVTQPADSEGVVASLQSIRVGLDFLASLSRFRIVLSDFDANGLELVINQSPRGEIEVEGADLPEPVADDLSTWIDLAGQWLSDPSVRVTRVSLGLRDGSGQLRQVEIPQLDLAYRRGLFHASGRAMSPGTTQQLASFRLVGQHFFRGDFTGQFYGDINSGRLFDGLIQEYDWKGIRVEGFDLGGQVWLTFRDGLMIQISGMLKTPYLQLGVGQESLAPLEDIQARFGWRRNGPDSDYSPPPETSDPERWYKTGEFHLNQLTWRWIDDAVPGFDLRFQAGGEADLLVAERFPIAEVRGLVSRLRILPARLTRALEDYRVSGMLNRLLLRIPASGAEQFRLTAELRDIGVRAHKGTPEVQGLSGSLVINRHGGLVEADTAALTFGFPKLFSGLWNVRNFRANVGWSLDILDTPDNNVIRVYSNDIAMDFAQSSQLTGAFDLKLGRDVEDTLSLRVGVKDGHADMLAQFVPVQLVEPGLYNWLTTAIEEVDIVRGTYFGHGPIGAGVQPGSFVSSMAYDFRNATVQYDERWPELTGAAGRVFVHEGNTRIDLASGQTAGIELQPGQVRVMPGGKNESPMVYVDAAAPVSGEVLADWMTRTPLGEIAGGAADSFHVGGDFYLDLGLGFALNSDRAPDVRATVQTESGTLDFPAADLQWTDVSGEITYDSSAGFSDAPVAARFLGQPVSVWFEKDRAGDGLIVRQAGRVGVTRLQERLGLAAGSSLGVDGTMTYEARAEVSSGKPVTINLESDLLGVTVGWPDPLGKPPEVKSPLQITLQPANADAMAVNVDWSQRMNLDIGWQSGRVDLAINDLALGDRRLEGIGVEAVRGQDNWLISILAEWIRGMIAWPVSGKDSGKREVTVDLEKLSLARSENELAKKSAPLKPEDALKAFRDLDLASWPDVNVRVADLQINDENAGIWSFDLRPTASQLAVENITGQLKSLLLKGTLGWRIENGEVITGFEGTLEGQSLADLGALMASEIPFRNSKTAIEMDFYWPGRPDQFKVDRLSGSAKVRFDDGVILEDNSTAQLFRIFNLLNSDTLLRRLKLDFSDLYEAGVAFDAISGKARFENGVLVLDPEIQIVGPSGAFKFSGKSNLTRETLDMNMVVVLPLTQNLPLAAVLLGAGAPIGGALFVLDKILGDPLSKLTSASYSVSGTWEEPEVRLKRIFDDG